LLEQVADKRRLQRSGKLLRLYQGSGAQKLLRHSGLLKVVGLDQAEVALPTLPPLQKLHERYPAQGEQRGRVGLFTGCIGSLLEGEVHRATVELLTRLGYEVYAPQAQGCCGSLHQHNGEPQKAHDLATTSITLFDGLKLDAVVSTASGCAAQLVEQGRLAGEAATPIFEACDFLTSLEWPESLKLKPLPQRVLLHLPCSQRNVLQRPDAVAQLLSRIPQLEIEPLAENHLCCGSAGSYQLAQPDNAEALRSRKLAHIERGQARWLVSNNLGCALHLQGGLQQRGMEIEVLHPLLLLRRALP
jgi:glycolate oxidase iron-sulfur subunit